MIVSGNCLKPKFDILHVTILFERQKLQGDFLVLPAAQTAFKVIVTKEKIDVLLGTKRRPV